MKKPVAHTVLFSFYIKYSEFSFLWPIARSWRDRLIPLLRSDYTAVIAAVKLVCISSSARNSVLHYNLYNFWAFWNRILLSLLIVNKCRNINPAFSTREVIIHRESGVQTQLVKTSFGYWQEWSGYWIVILNAKFSKRDAKRSRKYPLEISCSSFRQQFRFFPVLCRLCNKTARTIQQIKWIQRADEIQ